MTAEKESSIQSGYKNVELLQERMETARMIKTKTEKGKKRGNNLWKDVQRVGKKRGPDCLTIHRDTRPS